MDTYKNASIYNDLSLYECGKEDCLKEKVISLTKKTYHLFHFVISGKGTLVLNNKTYNLAKGSLFYIPPNTDALYYSDKEDPWSYEWIGFDGIYVYDYLSSIGLSIDNPIIFDNSKTCRKYFDSIVSRYILKGYLDMHALGSMYQLFSELNETLSIEEETRLSNSKVTVMLAKDFINNNYQFDIKISDIAKNANVTPNYLSSIFQKEEGISTKTYLTNLRMEKAIGLLKNTSFKVKDVSLMVGYKNQLHFSNEFKKVTGKSPLNYLKEEI